MAIRNLHDLYLDQLQEAYAAAKSLMPATTEMAREAPSDRLSVALVKANRGLAQCIDAMAQLLDGHKLNPSGIGSKTMDALVAEARRKAIEAEFSEPAIHDLAIGAQYRRLARMLQMTHSTAGAYAERLGLAGDAAGIARCVGRIEGDSDGIAALLEAELALQPAQS